jgi:hypothetical protein
LILLGKTKDLVDPFFGEGGFPIILPGEKKVISSHRISDYLDGDVWYYIDFYTSFRELGSPFSGGWTEWPPWTVQLIKHFSHAVTAVKRYNQEEANRRISRRR